MQTKDYRAIRRTLSPLETHFAAPVAQRQKHFASLDEQLFNHRTWSASDHETRRTIILPRASKAGASALRLIRMTTPGTLSCAIVVDSVCTRAVPTIQLRGARFNRSMLAVYGGRNHITIYDAYFGDRHVHLAVHFQ